MMHRDPYDIKLDVDKQRLREIVSEALRMIYEYLGGNYNRTHDEIMSELEYCFSLERVTTKIFLKIGSEKVPDLVLRLDPVKKKVLCLSKFTKKKNMLNTFMRIL